MAVSKEVGELRAKVKLETQEVDKGVKTLGTTFRAIEHEFKMASVGLDKVSDASKITALRAEKLTAQINVQKAVVDTYKQALTRLSSQEGDNTKKIQSYELSLKKAETQLTKMEGQLKTATDAMNRHGISAQEAGKRFKDLGITWESTGRKFTQIGQAMTAAITAPIVAAGTLGIKFNAQMEDFQANFETMLGSAESAQVMLQNLTDFAKSTPFEMTGLADAAKTLLNFGVSSQDVMKNLQMLGDVSLGNQEKLGRLTLAFGQIQSTGRLMGQDLLQLVNAGFNPLQVISEKTGQSMASLKEDMENGAISADMITEAFEIATSEGGIFFGAMEKGSKTLNGQWSTLKDTINITLGESMKPIFDDLSKNVFPKMIAAVERLGKYMSSLSDEQKTNVIKWAAIAAAAGPVLIIFGKLIAGIPALIAGFKAIKTASLFLVGNPVILGITALAAGIALAAYWAGEADREINAMTDSLIESYEKAAEAEKAAIDASHADRLAYLDSEIAAAEEASDARLEAIDAEYQAEVDSIAKKEKALKKALQEKSRILDDDHNDAIDRIRAEYGVFEQKQKSKTDLVQDEAEAQKDIVESVLDLSKDIASQEGDAFSKTYDAILEKARSIHDEKLRMYQEEYLQSVILINQDLAQKVGGYQAEIDEITKKTAEENRIAEEQADAEKILDLQAKLANAKSFSEYEQANKDLAAEVNRQNRAKELANRQIQIESLNEQIRVATEKANEEKTKALEVLNAKTSEQQTVIDAATTREIEKIQAVRLAKEAAENAKYNAAKLAIEQEEEALDGWGDRYKAELAAQVKAKQLAETAKLKATIDALNAELKAEQAAATAAKAKVDQETALKSQIANLEAKLKTVQNNVNKPTFGVFSSLATEKEIASLQKQISDLKSTARAQGIPGFASGVTNWRGGLARVNENGGEIRYLDRGTTVIPNDVSMAIAKAVGSAAGSSGGMAIDYDRLGSVLARSLSGMRVVMDGETTGRLILDYAIDEGARRGITQFRDMR